jgi:hypothetical protein
MGICPRCKKPLNLSHPDAIDFNGQRFHSECAKKAGAPVKFLETGFLTNHADVHIPVTPAIKRKLQK